MRIHRLIGLTLSISLASTAAQQSAKTQGHGLYVALGDSITAGTGVQVKCTPFPVAPVDVLEYCPGGTSYAVLTAKAIRQAGLADRFLNLGIPGANVTRVLKDEVPRVPSDATLITLYVGTNDSRHFEAVAPEMQSIVESFTAGYRKVLAALHKKAPGARIVLVNIPNEGTVGETYKLSEPIQQRFEETSLRMDRFINGLYPQYSVADTLCDPRSYIVANRDKGSVHPNDAGAADLADAVIRTILAVKPEAPPATCPYIPGGKP